MAFDANQLLVAVKAFSRANPLPIDATSVYESLEEARAYAKAANAYAGQVITVKEGDTYNAYILSGANGSLTLSKVGVDASEVKNYVQVVTELPATGQTQGVIYVNTTDHKGYIYNGESFVTIFEEVQDLQNTIDTLTAQLAAKADKGTTLGSYGIEDAYTKDEANKAIAAAVANADHLKRALVESLPTSDADKDTIYMVAKMANDAVIYHANAAIVANSADNQLASLTDLGEKTLDVGDYVTDSNSSTFKVAAVSGATFSVGDAMALPVDHYDEYLFINGTFEKIGDSKVDLSGYATKGEVSAAKQGAIDAAAADATTKADAAKTAAQKHADDAIAALDVEDRAVAGEYVSAVSETDGKITVSREKIPAAPKITPGTANDTIAVDGTNVAVKGLGSAAYTNSTAYATAAQGALADSAVQSITEGTTPGAILVDSTSVPVHGLGSAAYTQSSAYATAAQGTKADQIFNALTWQEA